MSYNFFFIVSIFYKNTSPCRFSRSTPEDTFFVFCLVKQTTYFVLTFPLLFFMMNFFCYSNSNSTTKRLCAWITFFVERIDLLAICFEVRKNVEDLWIKMSLNWGVIGDLPRVLVFGMPKVNFAFWNMKLRLLIRKTKNRNICLSFGTKSYVHFDFFGSQKNGEKKVITYVEIVG